ncbi:universal stress protein [Mucilaginibacter sp. 22184]|uniref:universal stress protein n=1 Tax=Mucilaginibacter sp. 22184 TaxID=3453887 RepID=UPI003F8685F3
MKTIVITTDFSDGSKQAVRYGFELARQLKANITLCNAMIIPAEIPQTGFVGWPPNIFEELMNDSAKELNTLKEGLLADGPMPGQFKPVITCVSQPGTVCDVVSQAVDLQVTELVVLGAHQKEGIGQWLIGNHTQRIIDTSNIPLLLVSTEIPFKKIKKIAFATDFSHLQDDLNCIRKLITIAEPLNAGILLVHVNNEKHSTVQLQHYLDEVLQELSKKLGYKNMEYKLIKDSRAVAGMDWLSKEGDIDMLAMVHRAHGFFAGLLKGSHTQKMAGHIHIPLLIFSDTLSV